MTQELDSPARSSVLVLITFPRILLQGKKALGRVAVRSQLSKESAEKEAFLQNKGACSIPCQPGMRRILSIPAAATFPFFTR